TVLDNPGEVPARLLAKLLVARGSQPGATPPKTLNRPPVGTLPRGTFVEVDHTLEHRTELVYQAIDVIEPFDGKSNSTIRPGGRREDETLLFVRRGEYSVLSVEARLAWLPFAYPLRKECYTLARDAEGVVSMQVPPTATRCRLSTVSASTAIAFR